MGACRLASAGLSFMELLQAIENFVEWKKIKTKKEVATYYVSYLKTFSVFLRSDKIKIQSIPLNEIVEFIRCNQEVRFSSSNVQAKAVVLKNFFTYWHRLGYPVVNPYLIPVPEVEEKRPRVADPKDYRKVIENLEADMRPQGIRNLAILKIYYSTAIRRTELLNLNLKDIDFEAGTITIKTQKLTRDCQRSIPLPPDALQALLRWLKVRNGISYLIQDKEALFVSLDAHKFGLRLGKSGVNEILRRLSKKLGIAELTPHMLRHLFAKDATIKNINNSNLSQMLGHRNLNTTRRYTRLFGKDLHKQYALVRR